MSLLNKLKLGIAGLSLLVGLNTANSQSIEGHVNSSGSYPRQAIPDAMVDAPGLGQDYTDLDGYYEIPGSSVPINPILHPQAGRQIRYEIFDTMGRRVKRFEEDPLENKVNDLSSGVYFIQRNDNIGEGIQRIIVLNQNNVIRGNIQYNVRYQPIMNLNSVNNTNNSSKADVKKVNGNGTDTDYIFTVSDDNIPGFTGVNYDYIDTLAIDSAVTKDVRLIEQFTIGTQYYDELLDLMNDLSRHFMFPDSIPGTISNYGEYPNSSWAPYPQRVWLNPQQAYEICTNPQLILAQEEISIDSINTKFRRESNGPVDLFTIVDDSSQANIKVHYITTGNNNWNTIWQDGHMIGGIVNIRSNLTDPNTIYRTFCHELGIHGLGMRGHSDDFNYISFGGLLQANDFQTEEVKSIVNYILQYNSISMANFIKE